MAKKLNLDLTAMATNLAAPAAPEVSGVGSRFLEVRTDDVVRDPKQPRKKFDPVKLQNLADLIKASQLNQPVTVKPKNADGKYVICLGERRWRANQLAGKETIPILISEHTDAYDQVTENTAREPLTPMEIADFIVERLGEGHTKSHIAKRLGMRPDAVSQYLALAKAPEFIQTLGNDTDIGARCLYDLVQAHKEFPSEVERFSAQDTEDVTRANLKRLIDGLKARKEADLERQKPPSGQPPQGSDDKPEGDADPLLNQPPKTGEGSESSAQPNTKPETQNTPALIEPMPETKAKGPQVQVMIAGRAATLAPVGKVSVIYEDTGECGEVDFSAITILGVEEEEHVST
ncbi:ParB/RepB/Spo0J family partition protein [Pseudomonas viridiflava]|uniref:ParB/RepB/Spo0J family partition protein n=1 Tax=Pseudomonas viridiflava TaxID=33069 RepID=UPI000F0423B5|nr:ParB/RepB/Spo0J family partition protein [Pseudomonas viridiflava]